uniref:Uncharacterized protein n=1 Tax=Rousettus aegyptiacus TaxID=9407 RepID=A0A7J8F0M9_ROUAE|nr:hypothetical protein HJG63_012359 [Rousettus aegyptiacus]
MKKCSTSLAIGEMQIETMSYYFRPTGIVIKRRTNNNKYWQGCGEIRTPIHCWWGCKMLQLLGKQFGISSNKHRVTIPSGNSTPNRNENICLCKTCVQMLIAALSMITKKWKQLKRLSIDE